MSNLDAVVLVTNHLNVVIIAPKNVKTVFRNSSTDNVKKSAEEIYFAIMLVKPPVAIVHLANLNAQLNALIHSA